MPIDRSAVLAGVRQSRSNAIQQRVTAPGEVTRRSETPVDWDGSTLDGNRATRSDRPSSVNRQVAMPRGGPTTNEATTGDTTSSANLAGSTLGHQAGLKKVTIGHKLSAVDWTGSMLMIASSTSFLVGLSWGGNKYPWRSPAVLVPTIVGLAGIVLTVLYEKRYAKNPFLRLAIYQHWSGIVVSICTIIQGYLVSSS